MQELEGYREFIQVVESGSFTAAAERLHVSKAHVSRSVARLENRLGTRLLNRSTRRLTLTEVGEPFFQRCREILQELTATEETITAMQQSARGTLRVTVAGAFGEDYVAPAAAEFMGQHENLRVELSFTDRVVDLIGEGYDLAIRAGTLQDSTLIARRIAGRELHLCASPAYLEARGEPASIDDLRHHNCLIGSASTWRLRIPGGGHTEYRPHGSWRSNNGRALRVAALRGAGIAQLPSFYIAEDLKAGTLVPILPRCQPTDTGIWAVYPSNRHLSAKVRLFVNFLVEYCRAGANGKSPFQIP